MKDKNSSKEAFVRESRQRRMEAANQTADQTKKNTKPAKANVKTSAKNTNAPAKKKQKADIGHIISTTLEILLILILLGVFIVIGYSVYSLF